MHDIVEVPVYRSRGRSGAVSKRFLNNNDRYGSLRVKYLDATAMDDSDDVEGVGPHQIDDAVVLKQQLAHIAPIRFWHPPSALRLVRQ